MTSDDESQDMPPGSAAGWQEPRTVEWAMLVPHARRDGLFLVAEDVDLTRVARAVADDDAGLIGSLIEEGRMRRPTPDELDADGDRHFHFAIVQPYVFAKGPIVH